MASSRFIDRSARVMWTRIVAQRRAERRWLTQISAMAGGLVLAVVSFFALKGAALAAGATLPVAEGWMLWLVGADPLSTAVGNLLQPVFTARG